MIRNLLHSIEPFAAILFALAIGATTNAAIVIVKNRAEPVIGTIVRDEKDRVVVRITESEGKTHEETFPRDQVEEIVPAYSPERLAALDPAKPTGYRDYAEELRARKRDPEARDMAIRLYLIAAWLDRENFARSGLLGLVSLARSPDEEKKFRAALYVHDPRTPPGTAQPAAAPATGDVSAPQELLRALRMMRTGKGTTARALAEKPPVAKLLESYGRILTRAEFNAAAGQTQLTPRELRQILLMELEMESIVNPASASEPVATSLTWSRDLQGEGARAVPSLALETLTEFDPRKCVYREGSWMEGP